MLQLIVMVIHIIGLLGGDKVRTLEFSKEELRFLLEVLNKATFVGGVVKLLHSVYTKIESAMKEEKDES